MILWAEKCHTSIKLEPFYHISFLSWKKRKISSNKIPIITIFPISDINLRRCLRALKRIMNFIRNTKLWLNISKSALWGIRTKACTSFDEYRILTCHLFNRIDFYFDNFIFHGNIFWDIELKFGVAYKVTLNSTTEEFMILFNAGKQRGKFISEIGKIEIIRILFELIFLFF